MFFFKISNSHTLISHHNKYNELVYISDVGVEGKLFIYIIILFYFNSFSNETGRCAYCSY